MIDQVTVAPALLFVVLLVGVAGFDWLRRRPGDLAAAMLLVLAMFDIGTGVLRLAGGTPEVELTGLQVALGQATTALVLLLALWAIGVGQRGRHPGGGVAQPAIGYALALAVAAVINGGTFPQTPLTMAVVMLAVHIGPPFDLTRVLQAARWGLALLLMLSVAAVIALPDISTVAEGGVPGLPFRAYGATSHPNTLGWFCVLFLVIDVHLPAVRRVSGALRVVAGGLLVLSQSKTSWVIMVVVGIVILWPRLRRNQRAIALAGASAALVVVVTFLLDEMARPQLIPANEAEALITLTGRTNVWAYGWETFLANPLAGAGEDVFSDYARETGRTWAAQAHNQIVQTVATGGLLVAAGLGAYWRSLVRVVRSARMLDRTLAFGLIGGIVMRSMTETPMDRLGLDTLLVFCAALGIARRSATDRRPATHSAGEPLGHEALLEQRTVPSTALGRTS